MQAGRKTRSSWPAHLGWLLVFSCVAEASTVSADRSTRQAAVWRAFAWMVSYGKQPAVLADYGSDFLEFHYELATSAADARLREQALKEGRALAEQYGKTISPAEDAEDALDLIAALSLLPTFGKQDARLAQLAQQARARFNDTELYGLAVGTQSQDPDQLCDVIISLHFVGRAGFASPTHVVWAINQATAYTYRQRGALSEDDRIAQDNLVSHVVYVLSDYGRLSLKECCLQAEQTYLKKTLPQLMTEGDVEMVGEFVDSLRILGHSDDVPVIAKAIAWLAQRQNPDGSFGDPTWEDIYDRYHATWTALNGLRGFRFQGKGPRWPTSACRPRKSCQ